MPKYSKSTVLVLISLVGIIACADDSTAAQMDADDEVDGDVGEDAEDSANNAGESGTAGADESVDTIADADNDADNDGTTTRADTGTSMTTGDGDTTTGDGDGDMSGDTATGDGDGDDMSGGTTTGDGDGDDMSGGTTMGDGDGDDMSGGTTMGDGDGDDMSGGTTMDDGDGDTSSDEGSNLEGPCADYKILSRADRKQQFNDGDGMAEWCDREAGGPNDDEWEGANWYRFMGPAGTRMPEFPPLNHSCGTEAPGWLLDGHPEAGAGVVERTVCFSWSNDTCQWDADIEVLNCGQFYVYNLVNTQTCALRYCGTD